MPNGRSTKELDWPQRYIEANDSQIAEDNKNLALAPFGHKGWLTTRFVGAQPSERMIIGSLRISRTSHAGRLPTGFVGAQPFMPAGWRSTSLVGAQPSERMVNGTLKTSRSDTKGWVLS